MSATRLLTLISISVILGMCQTVSALKCWKCSSQSEYTFCKDPFNATEQHKRWAYVECALPQDQLKGGNGKQHIRPICRKFQHFTAYEEYEIIRDCFWQYAEDECFYNKMFQDSQIDFCETCSTDGCNGVNHNSATELAAILRSTNGLIVIAVFQSYLYGKMEYLSRFGTFQ